MPATVVCARVRVLDPHDRRRLEHLCDLVDRDSSLCELAQRFQVELDAEERHRPSMRSQPDRISLRRYTRANPKAQPAPAQAIFPPPRQPKVSPWVGRQASADPTAVAYRLIRRPAVAEIVGDGRPWTVLMISLLSMPWR